MGVDATRGPAGRAATRLAPCACAGAIGRAAGSTARSGASARRKERGGIAGSRTGQRRGGTTRKIRNTARRKSSAANRAVHDARNGEERPDRARGRERRDPLRSQRPEASGQWGRGQSGGTDRAEEPTERRNGQSASPFLPLWRPAPLASCPSGVLPLWPLMSGFWLLASGHSAGLASPDPLTSRCPCLLLSVPVLSRPVAPRGRRFSACLLQPVLWGLWSSCFLLPSS